MFLQCRQFLRCLRETLGRKFSWKINKSWVHFIEKLSLLTRSCDSSETSHAFVIECANINWVDLKAFLFALQWNLSFEKFLVKASEMFAFERYSESTLSAFYLCEQFIPRCFTQWVMIQIKIPSGIYFIFICAHPLWLQRRQEKSRIRIENQIKYDSSETLKKLYDCENESKSSEFMEVKMNISQLIHFWVRIYYRQLCNNSMSLEMCIKRREFAPIIP